MPALVGFGVLGSTGPLHLEFWDNRRGALLVSVDVPQTLLAYQYFWSQDFFVKDAEDILVLCEDQIDPHVEIWMRFGDRNPFRM